MADDWIWMRALGPDDPVSREIERFRFRPDHGPECKPDVARPRRGLLREIERWSGGCFKRLCASWPPHFSRKLVAATILALSCGAACADPLVQVYAIRGLAGVAFSRGINLLCDELTSIPDVACRVEDFYDEPSVEQKAAAAQAAGRRLVLVGHSLGAHAALAIAAAMKGPVPLIVTINSNWFAPPAVPANAEIVLNYYQNFDVLGRATLTPPPNFRGEFRQFLRSEPHVGIDRSPDIHAEIVSRIRNLLTSLKPPPPTPVRKPPAPDKRRP